MNKSITHPIRHSVTGFTLIEVLVALVILSVGLLGIAGMISVSLKS
ncbi:MAG: type IV pilus modification PilV family protein, partial [Gammaproteobacteria bacterium]